MPLFRVCIAALAVLLLSACSAGSLSRFIAPAASAMQPSLTDSTYITRDRVDLPLSVWAADGPPQAVVVAVHGMNDYRRAFQLAGPWFAERGVSVYAYDQRGHGGAPDFGTWAGHPTMRRDLVDLLHLVHDRHPQAPLYLLGESMGTAIAVLAATDAAVPDLAGVVLSAPAIRPRHAMPAYQRLLGGIVRAVASDVTVPMGPTTSSTATDNQALLEAMSHDPLIPRRVRLGTLIGIGDAMNAAAEAMNGIHAPLLMLLGEKDTVLPQGSGDAMLTYARGVLPDVTTRVYPNGHHLLLRDRAAERVYADILAWMQRPAHDRAPAAATQVAEGL